MLSYKIEFFSLCKYFHWYLSTIQISYAVGFFSPSVSSVKGKDVSVSMQDLKLTLKSCVRITKDKNVRKKTSQKSKPIKQKKTQTNHDKTNKQGGKNTNPQSRRAQVRQSVDSSITCQNEKVRSNGLSECDFLQIYP